MNPLDQDLYNWEYVEYKPLLEHLPESGLNRHCVAENAPDSAAAGWTDLVLEWAVLLWWIRHNLSCVLVDYPSIAFMLESSLQTFFSPLLHRVVYGFYCNPLCSSHQQCREQIWDQQLKCVINAADCSIPCRSHACHPRVVAWSQLHQNCWWCFSFR